MWHFRFVLYDIKLKDEQIVSLVVSDTPVHYNYSATNSFQPTSKIKKESSQLDCFLFCVFTSVVVSF